MCDVAKCYLRSMMTHKHVYTRYTQTQNRPRVLHTQGRLPAVGTCVGVRTSLRRRAASTRKSDMKTQTGRHRQADRQTDRLTDRQTDRQRGRQADS